MPGAYAFAAMVIWWVSRRAHRRPEAGADAGAGADADAGTDTNAGADAETSPAAP